MLHPSKVNFPRKFTEKCVMTELQYAWNQLDKMQPYDPGCSTKEDEPWYERGTGRDGRKPPFFAMYSRVPLQNRSSIRRVCGGLREITAIGDAHYLWCSASPNRGVPYVEIWAHPSVLEKTRKLVQSFICSCSSERYPTIGQQRANARQSTN